MKSILTDLKSAAAMFMDMRNARKREMDVTVKKIPFIRSGGFYNTVEGCTLSGMDNEIVCRAEAAFNKLSEEEKNRLYFSVKNGEFIERALFWKKLLSSAMTPEQCHTAMKKILHWYIHIKQMKYSN